MKERFRHPLPVLVGIVAYYKLWSGLFDGTNVFDYALNGFVGVPTGTDIAPAYPGFEFNGTDDRILFTSGPSSVKTIIMWIKKETPGTEGVIDLNASDLVFIDSVTLTLGGFATGTNIRYVDAVVTNTIPNNEWTMIAVTSTTARNASAGNMRIGVTTTNFFDGPIGETWLFDRVLSPAEIKSIYELTKWRYPNN